MAKPNYSFEKRQRELAKKKQQDEKQARKKQASDEAKAAAAAVNDTGSANVIDNPDDGK